MSVLTDWIKNPPTIVMKSDDRYYKKHNQDPKCFDYLFRKCQFDMQALGVPAVIIKYSNVDYANIVLWSKDNTQCHYLIFEYLGVWCVFWDKKDAMHCRLIWG